MSDLTCYRCGQWDDATQLCACPDRITIFCGKVSRVLPQLAPASVDVVIADSPYSSGGMMRSDRNQAAKDKYMMTGTIKKYPDFSGDNRDQRSFEKWAASWAELCHEVTRSSGALLSFVDWRNLPCMIDAVQMGGWVYRGIVPWDKTDQARPQKGWFASQCEYIVTASSGALQIDYFGADICQQGFIRCPTDKDKLHITGKPVLLYRELLRTRNDWQVCLDPFLGSGPSLVACKELGRRGIGIEVEERYAAITAERLNQTLLPMHHAAAQAERPAQRSLELATEEEPEDAAPAQ